jgi:hypothetical protein
MGYTRLARPGTDDCIRNSNRNICANVFDEATRAPSCANDVCSKENKDGMCRLARRKLDSDTPLRMLVMFVTGPTGPTGTGKMLVGRDRKYCGRAKL